jgi:hypothetical protein
MAGFDELSLSGSKVVGQSMPSPLILSLSKGAPPDLTHDPTRRRTAVEETIVEGDAAQGKAGERDDG